MAHEIRATYEKSEHESRLFRHPRIISGICNESRLAEVIDRHCYRTETAKSIGWSSGASHDPECSRADRPAIRHYSGVYGFRGPPGAPFPAHVIARGP